MDRGRDADILDQTSCQIEDLYSKVDRVLLSRESTFKGNSKVDHDLLGNSRVGQLLTKVDRIGTKTAQL